MKGKPMSLFKLGKTRLPHHKETAGIHTVYMAPPKTVSIPMAQHIGAPATPVVKVGDTVYVGTLIGEAAGFVSAAVHSSVSGTVKKLDSYMTSNGRSSVTVVIESDGEMTPDPSLKPPVINSFADLSAAARAAGLVGLGGAGFPTAVKLDPSKISSIDTLLLNGAECEPFITSDTRTMLEQHADIKRGVELLLEYSSIPRAIVGIERNKPECIEKMRQIFAQDERVSVSVLPDEYPQGAEKVLIFNTTGRVVPEGGLPSDVGILVMNVTSVAALARFVDTGMPLVKKCVTVDGSAIKSPCNLIVPVGTSVSDVIEAAGGFACEPGRVMFGGPMMGITMSSLDEPVLKNNNAVVALSKRDSKTPKRQNCIHCGRCVAACPMGLNPTVYSKALEVDEAAERIARYESAKLNLCIECGCCSYVCPSARPLVENNRLAKAQLREYNAAKAKKREEK